MCALLDKYSLVENMPASDVLYAEWVFVLERGPIQKPLKVKLKFLSNEFTAWRKYKDLVLKRILLAPTNRETHQLNEEIFAALEVPAHVYNSVELPH